MVVILFELLHQSNYHTGDLREELVNSASIGKVIALMMPSDLNWKVQTEVRTVAVNTILSLAGHGMSLL
jgi:hypothetical protein